MVGINKCSHYEAGPSWFRHVSWKFLFERKSKLACCPVFTFKLRLVNAGVRWIKYHLSVVITLVAMCEFGIGALIETLRRLVRGIIDPLEPSDQSHQLTVDSTMKIER